MSWLAQLRSRFDSRSDDFAGRDLDNVHRLGSALWAALLAIMLVLFVFTPPTGQLGAVGWIPAGLVAAFILGVAVALRTRRLTGWGAMLAVGYLAAAGLAVLVWLGGTAGSPYDRLFLFVALFVAAIQPLRRIVLFLGFILLARMAPFLYEGGSTEELQGTAVGFLLVCGMSLLLHMLMSGVRAQRLAMIEGEERAREEARIDSLTGLQNRRAFDEALEIETARARRLDVPLSIAMLDIERFKEINDRWGYAEGDRALREVSATIRSVLRRPEFCYRWGGDEFLVVLTGTDAAGAEALGTRLADAVAGAARRPDGEPVKLRFAVSELSEEMPPSKLVEIAGLALTDARGASRTQSEAAG